MKREFNVNGLRFKVVDRNTGNMDINDVNTKYDLMGFSEDLNAWTRICGCNKITECKEHAEEMRSKDFNDLIKEIKIDLPTQTESAIEEYCDNQLYQYTDYDDYKNAGIPNRVFKKVKDSAIYVLSNYSI